jgi:hypothetical protein
MQHSFPCFTKSPRFAIIDGKPATIPVNLAAEADLKQTDPHWVQENGGESRPVRRNRPVFWVLVLAILCVGGMELAFCGLFSPALYHKITDPVVQPVVRAVQAVQAAAKRQKQAIEDEMVRWTALRLRDALASQVMAGAQTYLRPQPVLRPELPQNAFMPVPLDVPDPAGNAVTRFLDEDGQTVLTGGAVRLVYFNQGDEAWRDKPFGGDPIGPYGCGPTALAMVVSSLTDQLVDPAQMAAWAAEHGYWCPGSGSYPSIVEGTAKGFGLDCTLAKDSTANALRRHVSGSGVAVALVGPGHFTTSGHFILIHGATLSGDVLVADPNSRENSLAAWDPQIILDEAAASNGDGVRLWFFTKKSQL